MPENPERVRQALIRSPGCSARRHAREMRLSRESVRTILQKNLKFHFVEEAIREEVATIDREMLERVYADFQ